MKRSCKLISLFLSLVMLFGVVSFTLVSCDDACEIHTDEDGDGLCDICSYQMVAEGNHFIRNQTGAEWLCEITAEDIAEIKSYVDEAILGGEW